MTDKKKKSKKKPEAKKTPMGVRLGQCGNCDGTGKLCAECLLGEDRCNCEEAYTKLSCDVCNGTGDAHD